MIQNQEKSLAAAQALQAVIIKARSYAYDEAPHTKIADILDRAEYLMALFYDERYQTSVFRKYLKETANSHGCLNALEVYVEVV